MDSTRFQIVFTKLSEAIHDENAENEALAESTEAREEIESIAELGRVVSEISRKDYVFHTGT